MKDGVQPIDYHSGLFDKYKEIDNFEHWEDFPEVMLGLGYGMDTGDSFVKFTN